MKGEVLDERSAIHRLREGDISGMEFLVRTYQGEALRAANLITRDMALAEDVVQDGFIGITRATIDIMGICNDRRAV